MILIIVFVAGIFIGLVVGVYISIIRYMPVLDEFKRELEAIKAQRAKQP